MGKTPQWEIELRKKLKDEVPEGYHNISEDTSHDLMTTKAGYINNEVKIRRDLLKGSTQEEIDQFTKDIKYE